MFWYKLIVESRTVYNILLLIVPIRNRNWLVNSELTSDTWAQNHKIINSF